MLALASRWSTEQGRRDLHVGQFPSHCGGVLLGQCWLSSGGEPDSPGILGAGDDEQNTRSERANLFRNVRLSPAPIDTMQTTAATPTTKPRAVRALRNAFACSARRTIRRLSGIFIASRLITPRPPGKIRAARTRRSQSARRGG